MFHENSIHDILLMESTESLPPTLVFTWKSPTQDNRDLKTKTEDSIDYKIKETPEIL